MSSNIKNTPKRKKRKQYKNYYIFDFETTGKKFFDRYNKAEVRMIATSEFIQKDTNFTNPKIYTHLDTREWLNHIFKKRNKSVGYANNLRNFDGEFLISILRENLDLIDELDISDIDPELTNPNKLAYSSQLKNFKIGDKAIKILATDNHKIISISVRAKNGKVFYFRCLLNLLNMSVKSMLISLNMLKQVKEIKDNEDYKVYDTTKKNFARQMKNKAFAKKRTEYIKLDILACYRYIQKDRRENKYSPFEYHRRIPLTSASHAWETGKKLVKETFNKYIFDDLFKGYSVCNLHQTKYHKGKKCYKDREYITHLSNEDYMLFSRMSRGGFTFLNDKYRGLLNDNVYSADINSHYPSVYSKFNLPCGTPKILKEIPEPQIGKMYCVLISIKSAYFKYDSNIYPPMLPKGLNNKIKGRYVKNYNGDQGEIELLIWENEYNLYLKYYYLNHEIKRIFHFDKTNIIANSLTPLIDAKFNAKTSGEKQGAKLIINSFYGKWIEKIIKDGKDYIFTDKNLEIIDTYNESNIKAWKYPPVGNFIAAQARVILYEKIEELIDNEATILYGDTDSIKFISKNWELMTGIGKNLGDWDMEWKDYQFKYLAPKTYMYRPQNGKWLSKMKGYNKQMEYKKFKFGMTLIDRLTGKRVDGGKVLYNLPYTINKNINLII